MNESVTSGVSAVGETSPFGKGDVRLAAMLIVAAVLTLFLIRATGYPRLTRHDKRVGAYVLDVVQNDNWIVQKDSTGEIASKPPLLTWCAAGVSLVAGRVSQTALHLPAAASACVTALVLLAAGSRMFGGRAGFFAAFAYAVSPVGYSQLAVARYDGVLALMVILAALAAFRAWTTGSGWTWFWLAAAAGTMTKGPLALVLGATGLLAGIWERRTDSPAPFRGNHIAGVLMFLLITGTWFALAYRDLGQPLIQKMIGRELIGHAVGSDDESSPLGFIKPSVDFILTFAPWSLLALVAFWRVWKRPDPAPLKRRFERFLLCGFLAGLIVFSAAGHQQGRLIVPLIPFAALLTGRELAEITWPWSNRRVFRAAMVLVVLIAGGVFLHAHLLLRRSSHVQEALRAQQVSRLIAKRLGANAPLTYVDSPFELQFYLNTIRPAISFERAADLLRGNASTWVVVCDFARLEKELGSDAVTLHEAVRWPGTGEPWIRVVGNRPLSATNEPVAMLLGPILTQAQSLHLENPRLNYHRGAELTFRGDAARGSVRIENQGDTLQKVSIRILDEASDTAATAVESNFPPGATWSSPGFAQARR